MTRVGRQGTQRTRSALCCPPRRGEDQPQWLTAKGASVGEAPCDAIVVVASLLSETHNPSPRDMLARTFIN
jgi:hypothetical protein